MEGIARAEVTGSVNQEPRTGGGGEGGITWGEGCRGNRVGMVGVEDREHLEFYIKEFDSF